MTREEMARVLSDVIEDRYLGAELTDLEADKARFALAALRGPWVKTADRLPTEADAGYNEEVITFYRDGETESVSCDYWAFVAKHPEYFPYWMPIPPLPEVEE